MTDEKTALAGAAIEETLRQQYSTEGRTSAMLRCERCLFCALSFFNETPDGPRLQRMQCNAHDYPVAITDAVPLTDELPPAPERCPHPEIEEVILRAEKMASIWEHIADLARKEADLRAGLNDGVARQLQEAVASAHAWAAAVRGGVR